MLEPRKLNCGCHLNGCFRLPVRYSVVKFIYKGLQMMLDTCHEIARYVSLSFNVSKCRCMVIGKMYNAVISPPYIGNLQIEWSDCIKYLGVYVVNCKHVKFDIKPVKRSFYVACNSIFSHSHGTSELAILMLQQTYSLSVLLYAAPALTSRL